MMRKARLIVLMLTLCLAFSGVALAADGALYQDAGELFRAWHRENPGPGNPFPYPDYVNGVWSTDGGMSALTFALVPGTPESAKEEILSQIVDESTATFVEGGPAAFTTTADTSALVRQELPRSNPWYATYWYLLILAALGIIGFTVLLVTRKRKHQAREGERAAETLRCRR